jgi:hypothetical protein
MKAKHESEIALPKIVDQAERKKAREALLLKEKAVSLEWRQLGKLNAIQSCPKTARHIRFLDLNFRHGSEPFSLLSSGSGAGQPL